MSGRHGGKEMMLGMEEHRIGNEVQPSSALRSTRFMSFASVMNSPHGKEPSQAFSCQHGGYVPSQGRPDRQAEREYHDQHYRSKLTCNPRALPANCETPGRYMQSDIKQRPDQQCSPP